MRTKILILGLVCLIFINCGQKIDEVQAKDVIKDALKLSEVDSLEILGILKESKDTTIVKFKLNDAQVSSKMRKYDTGWLLDEIQNDKGTWAPAESLINLIAQAKNKNKQIKIMTDITIITTAIADYITDNGVVPKQDGTYDKDGNFFISLCPFYIKELPIADIWGNKFRVYCGTAVNGNYGITDAKSDDFLVISYGKDDKRETWQFNPSSPESGLFIPYNIEDYYKDLVMWNGSWIRAPRIEGITR